MKIALYGGSFNPPHVAHVLAAAYALSIGDVERVLVVPVLKHAFDKELVPFEDRARMCELALDWIPGVEVSRVEASLGAPSRTLRTLEHLAAEHPNWQFRLLIGSDVLSETHKWFAFEEVRRLAPPLVLGRVGFPSPEAPAALLPDVSSTRVRELCAARERNATCGDQRMRQRLTAVGRQAFAVVQDLDCILRRAKPPRAGHGTARLRTSPRFMHYAALGR